MPHVVNIKFDGVGLTSFTSQKGQEKERQKRLSNFVFHFLILLRLKDPMSFHVNSNPQKKQKKKKKPICMISLCFMRRMNLVIISYYISYIIYYYIIKVGLKSCNCRK